MYFGTGVLYADSLWLKQKLQLSHEACQEDIPKLVFVTSWVAAPETKEDPNFEKNKLRTYIEN